MSNKKLDLIDSIFTNFEDLKQAIKGWEKIVLENRIDNFWHTTMWKCLNCFWEDSDLYNEANKIYGEVLLWVQTNNYEKIQWALKSIESFLEKLHLERQNEIC